MSSKSAFARSHSDRRRSESDHPTSPARSRRMGRCRIAATKRRQCNVVSRPFNRIEVSRPRSHNVHDRRLLDADDAPSPIARSDSSTQAARRTEPLPHVVDVSSPATFAGTNCLAVDPLVPLTGSSGSVNCFGRILSKNLRDNDKTNASADAMHDRCDRHATPFARPSCDASTALNCRP
jgi:hypothetical protein